MANLCDDNLLTEWRTPDLDLVLHTIGETVIWGFMKHIFDILLQSVCLFHGHRQLKTENRLKLKLKWAVNHFRGNWQTKCEVKRSTIKVIVGGTWEGRIPRQPLWPYFLVLLLKYFTKLISGDISLSKVLISLFLVVLLHFCSFCVID